MPEETVASPITTSSSPSPAQPIAEVSGVGVESSGQPTPPSPPPLDPGYIAKGQRWKISEEDLRQVPQHVFDRLHAAAENELLESLAMADMRANDAPRDRPPQPAAQAPPSQPVPADDSFAPLAIAFDGEEPEDAPYRKHIENVVGWANQAVQKIVQQHKEEMAQVAKAFQQMRDANDYNIVDHHIASWGDEWADTFGKGPNFALDPNSQESQRRGEVLMAAKERIKLDKRMGRPSNVSDVLLRARAQLFPDKQAAITRAAQEKRLKELSAQLPPATNRMGALAAAGANGSVRTSDAEFLRRVRGG